MKKIGIMLCLSLLLAACAHAPATPAVESGNGNALAITAFLQDLPEYKSAHWKKVADRYERSDYAAYFDSINAPDYFFAILPLYDVLSLTEAEKPRREGRLMLSGIPAYREVNGAVVTFGFDYTYEQDTGAYKKGTRETARGEFDAERNTLFYENTVNGGGQVLARTVIEVSKQDGGSYAYQYLYSSAEHDATSALFCELSKESFAALLGEKQEGVGFSYQSIRFGHTALEHMREGFDIVLSVRADADGAAIEE